MVGFSADFGGCAVLLGAAASSEIAVGGGYAWASIGNLFGGCDRADCDFFHSCPAQDVGFFGGLSKSDSDVLGAIAVGFAR